MGNSSENKTNFHEGLDMKKPEGFFDKYGPKIFLAGFILYLILLSIGTGAEVFKRQSILDWWIWRPPGR